MSFLNPVSEPVKRFSSTDAGAPQINYNARVAGDVKTVLKACLVTGYGDKASAGWSIANEVNHVAEFVSPSVAMSDYRLGIDDTSTSSTTWYYKNGDAKYSPAKNSTKKGLNYINASHPTNGWILLVTQQGFYFIEMLYVPMVSARLARVTYFGRIKAAVTGNYNICFWCVGWGQPESVTPYFFNTNEAKYYTHYAVGTYSSALTATNFGAVCVAQIGIDTALQTASIQVVSPTYIYNGTALIGEHPGMYLTAELTSALYGIQSTIIGSRDMLDVSVCSETTDYIRQRTRRILIPLDYWEY